jgi:hypothetical protein
MNLVEIATWIQEGQREAYDGDISSSDFKNYVIGYVMIKGKGHLNPRIIGELVDLETSIPDKNGFIQCSND